LSNIEWKVDAVKLAEGGLSWRAIAKELDVPRTTVSDFLRKHFDTNFEQFTKPTEVHMIRKSDKEEDNSRILLVSDLHIPYHHKDSIAFLKHLKEKYNPTRVICLGDEVDGHALSYHDSDPDLPSAGDELRKALPVIQELYKLFPKMDIIESNHGSLIWRKAKTNGIPKHYIKSYNDVLGVDDGWKWSYDLTVKLPNGTYCYIHHGKSNDVIKASQLSGMSAVQGHYHEKFKIDYWGNATGLYFGLQCGCLIDDDAYAFSYNNCNLKRPIIGTGLIIDSQPILEPMVLDKEGRWQDREV
jgi:predicted transcriptional regulator